jgi:enoyl-CoA hydratase
VNTILYSVEGGVATVMLDRPEARNALNGAMCDELRAACERAAADSAVRLVLVRGNGPVFCAGADVKERQGMSKEQVRERRMKAFTAYAALEALPMPSIAVVQGAALGSGAEIAAACDLVVALPDAVFGTPEALRGSVGATQRLPRVLGKRLAKDLMFTGRRLTADEAMQHGLVARVFPHESFESSLQKIVSAILSAPPAAMRLAKRCIDQGVELDPVGALALEIAAIDEQLASGQWMGKS